MTDKQIIIDGCDVSGCEFYNKDDKTCREANGKYNIDICDFDKCENSNCYYKNWQRKEQECERLKNIINEAKNSKLDLKSFLVSEAIQNEYEEQLDQLNEQLEAYKMEAEEGKEINAELKAENDEYYLFIEKLCDYAGLECDNEEQAMRTLLNLASQMNKARWIIDRYKQTLTEIKEIAENAYCLTNGTNKDMANFAKQILQKISECEVE